MTRKIWGGLLFALGCLIWAAPARAQSWVTDVHLSVATGIEGADNGAAVGWQRARTRLVFGLDLGNDETGLDAYGVRTFVELERTISVGAELGYAYWFLPELGVFFGGTAVLTPRTLFGGTAALTYVIPLSRRFGIPIWGSFSALPLGGDRPGDGTVVWGLLGLGVRGRL